MGAVFQALEIIFEEQMKLSNEKITRKKKSFATHKTHFFSFLSTPPTLKSV
jgi:hypothetical protein